MNVKPTVAYHVDKLELTFELPEPDGFVIPDYLPVFIPASQKESNPCESVNLWDVNPVISFPTSLIFIFRQGMPMEGRFRKILPPIEVFYEIEGTVFYMGVLKTHLEGAIRLEVDNAFLYSTHIEYLKYMEESLGVKLYRISNLDICLDSNQNLPRKLNDTLHSSKCVVTRPGSKKQSWMTPKGNMILGKKIGQNIKILQEREKSDPTYIFELNGGTTKVIRLVGYNKEKEIEEFRSKKKYIMEAQPFDGRIYRLELRFQSQFLTTQAKKEWSLRFIFENLHDEDFLKEFFIRNLDKFYRLKINNRKIKISELLRLD